MDKPIGYTILCILGIAIYAVVSLDIQKSNLMTENENLKNRIEESKHFNPISAPNSCYPNAILYKECLEMNGRLKNLNSKILYTERQVTLGHASVVFFYGGEMENLYRK